MTDDDIHEEAMQVHEDFATLLAEIDRLTAECVAKQANFSATYKRLLVTEEERDALRAFVRRVAQLDDRTDTDAEDLLASLEHKP